MLKSKNINCRVCGCESQEIFFGMLRNISVCYFDCPTCGYVQTETPHWLEQAYAEVINDSDTGIMSRNLVNARIVLATMAMLGKLNGTVVDCAGGYGILVRLLRDYGLDALWSDRYCQNLLARGFEYTNEPAELVTAFEAFEHFVNPAEELDRLLSIAPNVLLSTEIIATPAPKQSDWWYDGKNHGQHIGFFRTKTLENMAEKRGLFLTSNGISYHLLTEKPINQMLWRMVIRLNKWIPTALRWQLKSKVWSDHGLMINTKRLN